MCVLNRIESSISAQSSKPLELVDHFTYQLVNDGESISLQYNGVTVYNPYIPQFEFFKLRQLKRKF